MKRDYFFCYNQDLMKYLKFNKGFNYITKAIHPRTVRMFWLFEQTEEVSDAVKEFNSTSQLA